MSEDTFPQALTAVRSVLALAADGQFAAAVSITRLEPVDGVGFDGHKNAPLCPVNRFVQEALTIRAPDEAFRVWCPNCGYVLCEYLHGVARYLCRSCKWEGVIARHASSLIVSCTTLRRGASETQWRKQPQRLISDKPAL